MGSRNNGVWILYRMSQGSKCHLNVWVLLLAPYSLGFLEKTFQIIMAHLYKTVTGQKPNSTEPIMHLLGIIPTTKSQKQTRPLTNENIMQGFPVQINQLRWVMGMLCYPSSQAWFFPTSHNTNDKRSYVVWAHIQPSVPVTCPPPQQLNWRKRA